VRRAATLALALLLAACGGQPDPAKPALWRADCLGGATGWLFGTVHALQRPAAWRGARIDKALGQADLLMVELVDDGVAKETAAVWSKLAQSPDLPPLSARVPPDERPTLGKVLKRNGLDEEEFADTETWAAALTIAQAATAELDSANGIDRAVMAAAKGKPSEELEGREAQLAIFDRLPEAEQRDLLAAVIADAARGRNESADLAAAWRKGDMAALAAETDRGMLADPELREALFTGRNRRWTARILASMAEGHRPFVAVGAAHMAGRDGLPAMLRKAGCKVARIQ
jgi:uncharacterized protein YbaP (TraB family)